MTPVQRRRRGLLRAAGAAAALAAVPLSLRAQAWPARPIRLICPFTAGGSTDAILRVMAGVAGRLLGATVVVENKPGAAGTLGAAELANARADGYTLSQIPMGVLSLPHMQKVAWHPLRDLTFVANLSTYTNGLVVRADAPWRSLGQFLDAARAQPGRLSYGCAGLGTYAHVAAEELAFRAGVKLLNVPYKGDADGLQALLGGHVMALSASSAWAPQVDSGACRLLAVYGSQRIRRWPEAPTLRELGFATIPESPFGIGAPRGLDPALLARLQDVLRQTMDDPSVVAVLEKYDMPVAWLGAADFARAAQSSFDAQREMMGRLGLLAP